MRAMPPPLPPIFKKMYTSETVEVSRFFVLFYNYFISNSCVNYNASDTQHNLIN